MPECRLKWLENLFPKKHQNPAVHTLYRAERNLDPKIEEIISLLPKMAEAIDQGGKYLYEKVLEDQIRDYDRRFGSSVSAQIDDSKKAALTRKLTSLMLVSFFNELSELYPDSSSPSSLTDALHFEIYQALPSKESFIDYLTYQNPNFEDPRMAPAFKFGNDVAEILETLDFSFSMMVSQQSPLISDISRKLVRLVLFNEPIEAAPQSQ
jgi:hypothetical protein